MIFVNRFSLGNFLFAAMFFMGLAAAALPARGGARTLVLIEPGWFKNNNEQLAALVSINELLIDARKSHLELTVGSMSKGIVWQPRDPNDSSHSEEFLGAPVNEANLAASFKKLSLRHPDLFERVDHIIIFSSLWPGPPQLRDRHQFTTATVGSLRKQLRTLLRLMKRRDDVSSVPRLLTVVLPDFDLDPSGVLRRETLSVWSELKDIQINSAKTDGSKLVGDGAISLMRRALARLRDDSDGRIGFVVGRSVNARDDYKVQFKEILCAQLHFARRELSACNAFDSNGITVRVDFDRALGMSSRHRRMLARSFPQLIKVGGPARSVRIMEVRSQLESSPAVSEEKLVADFERQHDLNADYHVRVVAGVSDEPFHRPTLHITARFGDAIRYQGSMRAPSENKGYMAMLHWLKSDLVTFIQESITGDYPVSTNSVQFVFTYQGRPLPQDGYQVAQEVLFNHPEWNRFDVGIVRNGAVSLNVPRRATALRLVVETEEREGSDGPLVSRRLEVARMEPIPAVDRTVVEIQSEHLGGARFRVPPEEGDLFAVGNELDLLVIRVGIAGDRIVYRGIKKLRSDQTILGPYLLPGYYRYELIPHQKRLFGLLGQNLQGGNSHATDIFFFEDPLAKLDREGNIDYEKVFGTVEDFGANEQQALIGDVRESVRQSAYFLRALLRFSSEVMEEKGGFEELRPLWIKLRQFIFGQEAKLMRHRLERAMEVVGLVDPSSNKLRRDAFEVVWAMFDWAISRRAIRYLSDNDHRLSYNAWIDNMTDRPERTGLFGSKFSAFLRSSGRE